MNTQLVNSLVQIIQSLSSEERYLLETSLGVKKIESLSEVVQTSSRRDFIKLPLTERRQILASQSEKMLAHYQQDEEWREWSNLDIGDIAVARTVKT